MYVTLRGTPGAVKNRPDGRGATGRKVAPTVIGLGAVSLLTDISSESVSAVLPLYITVVIGMGPLAYGFVDGIYQGVSALVRILGGWWADRLDRPKWVALGGYGISAASRVVLLVSQGFWPITSTVAVDRIGKGLRTGPRDALIATASPPDFLGRNFGVHRTMDTIGALIGPLLAFAVLAVFPFGLHGYQTVFVASLAAAVMGVAVLALIIPDLRRRQDSTAVTAPPARPRLKDLAQPGLRRLLIAAGMLSVFTVGDGFLYLSLQDGGQIADRFFPLLFVGTNIAYLSLAIPLGRLADRVGRGRVFLAGHIVLLAAYPLAASHLGGLPGAVIVLLLLGTFYAATDGVLSALATREVPEAVRASGISAAQTVVAITRFASSVGFGLMWQFASRGLALMVMTAGLALAVPLSAGLLRSLRGDLAGAAR
jgi:MFS family permease